MASTAKGLALAAKVTALTGPTAGQKAQLQKVVEVIDSRLSGNLVLDNDLTRIYDALNGLS